MSEQLVWPQADDAASNDFASPSPWRHSYLTRYEIIRKVNHMNMK